MRRFLSRSLLACICSVALVVPFGCDFNVTIQEADGASGGKQITGSGSVKSEQREVADFTAIQLDGIGSVVVIRADEESVTVNAEDNLLPYLTSDVVERTLKLAIRDGISIQANQPIEITVNAKDIDAVTANGTGSIKAKDIESERFSVTIRGTGEVAVAGRTSELTVRTTGTGSLDAAQLEAKQADVRSTGTGNAVVNVREELNATVQGTGSIEYLGNPVVKKRVSGVGRVSKH